MGQGEAPKGIGGQPQQGTVCAGGFAPLLGWRPKGSTTHSAPPWLQRGQSNTPGSPQGPPKSLGKGGPGSPDTPKGLGFSVVGEDGQEMGLSSVACARERMNQLRGIF